MKIDIKKMLNEPELGYQKFHESTKYRKIRKLKDHKYWPKVWKTIFFKSYPRFEEILLPKPTIPPITLKKVLFDRASLRTFSELPVDLKTISALLYFSAGLRRKNTEEIGNRFYPSGGARYPLETYVIPLKGDLPKGIYHYYLKSNSLEKIDEFEQFDSSKYFLYKWVENASYLIVITAVFSRSTVKYQDKGYILSMIEAGALMQNFYLIAPALGLGICALAGFIEDELNKLLDIDGKRETVVMVLALGKKLKQS